VRRLTRFGENRADAQALPELAQTAQHGGFGQFAAQSLAGFGRGAATLLIEQFPQFEHQRRHFVAGGFLRSALPVRVGAQTENIGQRLRVGEKIRLLPHRAKEVQRHHRAGGDQAGQERLRLLDGGQSGGCVPAAQASFDKRGRRRRQLRMPRQIKAQRMLGQPALRIFKSKDGTLVLAPVRRPCCLELLCYQERPFSRGVIHRPQLRGAFPLPWFLSCRRN
jgi:hypothetical protein